MRCRPSKNSRERHGHSQGLTDRQIGERLKISGATASKHVANLLAKTQQRNRLALAVWARIQGLVEPD